MTTTLNERRQLDNSLRPPRRAARVIGRVDPNENIRFSIVVRRRPDAPPLPDHDYWMSVPPGRRTFLSREELAAKHGAAPEEIDVVVKFCRDHGFTVVDSSVARRCVVASATAEVVAKVFGVELKTYATPDETYRGHEGYVQLPSEIADVVAGVLGFDNRRLGTHSSNGGPSGAKPLTPTDVAKFYHFPFFVDIPFPAIEGSWKDATDQTIGILEFGGGYDPSDFQSYFASPNIVTPAQVISIPASVPQDGSTQTPKETDIEVALDVEVAGAIAQGAKIVIYFGTGFSSDGNPNEAGWHDLLSKVLLDQNKPTVLSISWSHAESDWSSGGRDMISQQFQDAAALGITVFASSGDTGASGYYEDDPNFRPGPNVHYPASDPWVTGCGGTIIYSDPPPLVEMTWNDAQYKGGATGGGYSNYFKTPAWQTGANSNPYRGVPDIAGNASGYSGYDLFVYGKKTSELNAMNAKIAPTYAGTSAVAPLYAGLMALINANLFPTNITTATSVGFLNPTLYDLGAKNASFVFQDVSDGLDNGFNGVPGYQSVAGWDPCTGWGSIGGAQLLEAILVGYIAQNPGCMAAIKKFLGMGG